MFLLSIIAIISTLGREIKNAFERPIPAENWANKELYHKDVMAGVSAEQRMKNVKNGKYRLTTKYPEPHRDPVTGKIIIENCKLYNEDVKKYGAYQAQQWVKQGRYNLSPEELKKEEARIKEELKRLYSLK